MKRAICYLSAMLLVFSALISFQQPVSALETDENYLGGRENITGYIEPEVELRSNIDQSIIGDNGFPYFEIFSITARYVTELLASDEGDKYFTRGDLPVDATYIIWRGVLFHSEASENDFAIKAGVCYKVIDADFNDVEYIAVEYEYTRPGELSYGKFPVLGNIYGNREFYSYVKNINSDGYVYGTLSLYYSKE